MVGIIVGSVVALIIIIILLAMSIRTVRPTSRGLIERLLDELGECLLGEQRVNQYIDRKIAERITDDDADDWEFIRTLTPSDSVDLASSTQLLFELLKGCRPELEALLRKVKQTGNPDFTDIDLDAFFVPPRTAK